LSLESPVGGECKVGPCTRYSIGELAQRTGLTVKTIRFYSDRGIVTPADRSPAGFGFMPC